MDKKCMAKKMVELPKEELVTEHKKLVKDLRSNKRANIKAELRKQSKELEEYEND